MSDNKQRAQGPIPIPSQEMVTGAQLANLLSVAGFMMRALEGSSESMFEKGSVSAVDGGAKMAAETAFVKACQRIEEIVEDKWRWKTTERDALVIASLDMVRQNVEFLKTQTAAAASVLRPSYRYQPSLARLADGLGWAVILGNPADADNSIIGVGETPEEAYQAFDDIFAGKANEKMKNWALAREKEIADNAKKELDLKRLDSTRGHATEEAPNRGNRRRARTKRQGGGHSHISSSEGDKGSAAADTGQGGS